MEKKYKVAVIHTSTGLVGQLKELFDEMLPDVEMINLIDDSLLEEVKKNGRITPGVIRRICTYAQTAQEMGAELIMCQCSSVSRAGTVAREMLSVPYLKIDEPMMQKAVMMGEKIALVATAAVTIEPSTGLIREMAAKAGKKVEVTPYLSEGTPEKILEKIKEAEKTNDVIVLAQGSMTCVLPYLEGISRPVLSSPGLALERIREILNENGTERAYV